MDITITRTLSDEELSAITTVTAAIQASGNPPITPQDYLIRELNGAIQQLVTTAYNTSVASLGDAAAKLSFTQRQALIAQVKAAVGG